MEIGCKLVACRSVVAGTGFDLLQIEGMSEVRDDVLPWKLEREEGLYL